MIVTLDANALIEWSRTKHGDPLSRARLEHLLDTISVGRGKVVIPAPSLAEFLVLSGPSTAGLLETLNKKTAVIIAPFDQRSAMQCALLDRAAIQNGDKKAGRRDSWQRIKIDRQVLAIAMINNSELVVSDDDGLRGEAARVGMRAVRIDELPVPPSALQTRLDFPAFPSGPSAPR